MRNFDEGVDRHIDNAIYEHTKEDGPEYVYCNRCGYRDEWFGTDYFGLCDDCEADAKFTGTIAIWFSYGAASAVAAKKTIEAFPNANIRVLNNPVLEEDADNLRFGIDVEKWLGVKIETVINSKFPTASAVDVWAKRKGMSFPKGAPCTIELKKKARQEWEKNNHVDYHVLGFTLDEQKRHERFILTERDNVLPVLIDANITKAMCFDILREAGIELPAIYSKGFPNANCIGCVKATSPTYWNLVRREYPVAFDERAAQSRELGARLVRVKGERIFLDELDPSAKGRPLKTDDFECGLFCEEKE
jgi:3'-phosphoadenosine 5'-phosphosulfate sulfotransferase (PAPS reductase)/FAD synthetase